jgi:H+/Cl- antiporter ClcA
MTQVFAFTTVAKHRATRAWRMLQAFHSKVRIHLNRLRGALTYPADPLKAARLQSEQFAAVRQNTPGMMAANVCNGLVLVATLATHLCGGSAGREGTAVQMGGSLADAFSKLCRLDASTRRALLISGIAAGFGSVFGTPLAGALFAIEVLVVGRLAYGHLLPALVASVVGDLICSAWGIRHPIFSIGIGEGNAVIAPPEPWLLLKVLGAAVVFGLAARCFSEITRHAHALLKRFVEYAPLRPVLGGLVVIGLVYLVGTRDYLGIGVSSPDPSAVTLLSAFQTDGAETWSWAWKLVFTVVTLASGFKGGEVTPLFFIGATLGHSLALWLGAPVGLFAGLGLIAIFAGATKTPLACTVLGIELFGAHHAVLFAQTPQHLLDDGAALDDRVLGGVVGAALVGRRDIYDLGDLLHVQHAGRLRADRYPRQQCRYSHRRAARA